MNRFALALLALIAVGNAVQTQADPYAPDHSDSPPVVKHGTAPHTPYVTPPPISDDSTAPVVTATPRPAPAIRYYPAPRSTPYPYSTRPRPVATPRPANGEQAVDLNSMDSGTVPSQRVGNAAPNPMSPHQFSGAQPNFKIFFDFALVNEPGISDLSFNNYHDFLFVEMAPSPDLMFSFDINTTATPTAGPRFFELDYNVSPKLQLRVGKIYIPFDDLAPHNIFGGRIGVSSLSLDPNNQFLPNVWTEMGIGARYKLLDTYALALETHLYVVNGFGSGGSDPVTPGSEYPNFKDISVTQQDNNRAKAIGARAHALFARRLGVGISYYTDRWNNQGDSSAYNLHIIGLDSQLRFSRIGTEFRAGIAEMWVAAPSGAFRRSGYYLEAGQKFGTEQAWKLLGRAGAVQLDSRVTQVTDQKIVGLSLIYKPKNIQWSLEHSRDLEDVPGGKPNYTLTMARMAIEF